MGKSCHSSRLWGLLQLRTYGDGMIASDLTFVQWYARSILDDASRQVRRLH
jgi:hypothetical protein